MYRVLTVIYRRSDFEDAGHQLDLLLDRSYLEAVYVKWKVVGDFVIRKIVLEVAYPDYLPVDGWLESCDEVSIAEKTLSVSLHTLRCHLENWAGV